ncbi:unknown [Prevotella sp. CAG:487]|nr:unknown [Prevotella sp. CAG:487]
MMSLFITTSPRIMSSTRTSCPGSTLKRTTYCCPSAMRRLHSSGVIVSELVICMRVWASYWKFAVSLRFFSSSSGVSKATYAMPFSSSMSTYFR